MWSQTRRSRLIEESVRDCRSSACPRGHESGPRQRQRRARQAAAGVARIVRGRGAGSVNTARGHRGTVRPGRAAGRRRRRVALPFVRVPTRARVRSWPTRASCSRSGAREAVHSRRTRPRRCRRRCPHVEPDAPLEADRRGRLACRPSARRRGLQADACVPTWARIQVVAVSASAASGGPQRPSGSPAAPAADVPPHVANRWMKSRKSARRICGTPGSTGQPMQLLFDRLDVDVAVLVVGAADRRGEVIRGIRRDLDPGLAHQHLDLADRALRDVAAPA
jgi:hypothetical protein